ncbi:MAG TPA: (2Fe-2S) ferredoxin domain-containing protein [Candidatus Melainabacteria bacterium]|nr:(2Fe-2S) ferredoxin domain-containing protein [Candidatus Melainabacteria bacterium]
MFANPLKPGLPSSRIIAPSSLYLASPKLSCPSKLLVCTKGKSCRKRNGPKLFERLKLLIAENDLGAYFELKKSDCFGLCKHAPIVKVKPDGLSYGGVSKSDCTDILLRHVKQKKPIKRLLIKKK